MPFIDILIFLILFLPLLWWLLSKFRNKNYKTNFKKTGSNHNEKGRKTSDEESNNRQQNKRKKEERQSSKENHKHSSNANQEEGHKDGSLEDDLTFFNLAESYTEADLKKARNQKLKENHPDKVSQMSDEIRDLAEKQTQKINDTYDRLKDRL